MDYFFMDFNLVYEWAKELITTGNYVGYYPYPTLLFFSPLTLIPKEIAGYLFMFGVLITLVILMKRKALIWLFYYPFLAQSYYNNVSGFFWICILIGNPFSLALLALKPHLLLFAIPKLIEWYKTSQNKLWQFLITVGCLYLPTVLMRPAWLLEFVKNQLAGNRLNEESVSLWQGGAVLAIGWLIFILIFNKQITRDGLWTSAILPLNPFVRVYDYTFIINGKNSIATVIISVILLLSGVISAGAGLWLTSLLAIFQVLQKLGSGFIAPSPIPELALERTNNA